MQPLNKNERRRAFLNFLLLFIISIILILTTIFVSIQVPFKENQQLQKDMRVVTNEHEFSTNYRNQMSVIQFDLDSITRTTGETTQLEANIKTNIANLYALVKQNDSMYNSQLYQNMTDVLSRLRQTIVSYHAQLHDNEKAESFQSKIDDRDTKLKASQVTIDSLNGVIRGLQAFKSIK